MHRTGPRPAARPLQVGAAEQGGLEVVGDQEGSLQVGVEQLQAVDHRGHVFFRADEAAQHGHGGLDVGSRGLKAG
jgi:hypothetical protein